MKHDEADGDYEILRGNVNGVEKRSLYVLDASVPRFHRRFLAQSTDLAAIEAVMRSHVRRKFIVPSTRGSRE